MRRLSRARTCTCVCMRMYVYVCEYARVGALRASKHHGYIELSHAAIGQPSLLNACLAADNGLKDSLVRRFRQIFSECRYASRDRNESWPRFCRRVSYHLPTNLRGACWRKIRAILKSRNVISRARSISLALNLMGSEFPGYAQEADERALCCKTIRGSERQRENGHSKRSSHFRAGNGTVICPRFMARLAISSLLLIILQVEAHGLVDRARSIGDSDRKVSLRSSVFSSATLLLSRCEANSMGPYDGGGEDGGGGGTSTTKRDTNVARSSTHPSAKKKREK